MESRIPPFLIAALLAIAILPLASAGERRAASPEEVRVMARDIIAGREYQKDYVPRFRPDESEIDRAIRSAADERPAVGFKAFANFLCYIAIGIAVILALVWGTQYFYNRRMNADAAAGDTPAAPDGRTRKSPGMDKVEKLAAAGRYGEAVHLMLLMVVARLCAARMRPLMDSLTSRELVRILPRSEEERSLFERLVRTVEVSLFGNRDVDREAYADCVDVFGKIGLQKD